MNVWIFKLFKYNLRFGVAPVNVLKLIRNIHILWLPPTASLDFLCVLKHPHVYPGKPGKVCNTLKLFCGCCFGRSSSSDNNNIFPTTVRFIAFFRRPMWFITNWFYYCFHSPTPCDLCRPLLCLLPGFLWLLAIWNLIANTWLSDWPGPLPLHSTAQSAHFSIRVHKATRRLFN